MTHSAMPTRMSLAFYATYLLGLYYLFFFNDTATTEIYTLSLHDALPIFLPGRDPVDPARTRCTRASGAAGSGGSAGPGSGEDTSELQSRLQLLCRLLLLKKKKKKKNQSKRW